MDTKNFQQYFIMIYDSYKFDGFFKDVSRRKLVEDSHTEEEFMKVIKQMSDDKTWRLWAQLVFRLLLLAWLVSGDSE